MYFTMIELKKSKFECFDNIEKIAIRFEKDLINNTNNRIENLKNTKLHLDSQPMKIHKPQIYTHSQIDISHCCYNPLISSCN